ncbi:MAG TPA: DUF3422 domain-containing protein [Dongiaceae bacterium]|nr:DUF3422 domain-containing protein [Dongiaceae bacterium]
MIDIDTPAPLRDAITLSRADSAHFRFHPEREKLFNELHTRPFPVLETGSRVSQFAVLHGDQAADAEYVHISHLCQRFAVVPPLAGSSCYYQDFGGFELRWERHNEFSTYTLIVRDPTAAPFTCNALTLLPAGWLATVPGDIIHAQHIDILDAPTEIQMANTLRRHFEGHRLISSWIGDQQARLWTAYRIHSDGFGRILILNRDLNPCQAGRLVRALLEVETYRMMLLTAFPTARVIAPQVSAMAQELALINQQINAIRGLDDERRLLQQLSMLAARIEQMISDSDYRFSAARAYYDLVISRLKDLREQEVAGMQTLNEFLRRRLTPAYRTCQSVSGQLDDLSQRIDRASELLRTRINLTLEAQNQALLQSMNQRSQLQLQLQQAVEGLSVAAISYYMVGLVKYLGELLHEQGWVAHPALLTGLAVPCSIAIVWWGVRRLRKRVEGTASR